MRLAAVCALACTLAFCLTPAFSFGEEGNTDTSPEIQVDSSNSIATFGMWLDAAHSQELTTDMVIDEGTQVYGTLDINFDGVKLASYNTNGQSPNFEYQFPGNITVNMIDGLAGTLYKKGTTDAIGTWTFDGTSLHFAFDQTWFIGHVNEVEVEANFTFMVDNAEEPGGGIEDIHFPGVPTPAQVKLADDTITTGKTMDVSGLGEAGNLVRFSTTLSASADHETAVVVDTMGRDLRYVEDSFKFDGAPVTPDSIEREVDVDGKLSDRVTFTFSSLKAGKHELTYTATVAEDAIARILSNPLVTPDNTKNTAQWTVDGYPIDPDSTILPLASEFLEKVYEVSESDASVLNWVVTVNGGEGFKADLSGFTAKDSLSANHSYAGTYKVRNSAGDVLYEEDIDKKRTFSYTFPAAGTWKDGFKPTDTYTIEYATKLSRTGDFSNTVDVTGNGITATKTVNDGVRPGILTTKEFTGDEAAAIASGRHTWKVTLGPSAGTKITDPSREVKFSDMTGTEGMYIVTSGNGAPVVTAENGVALVAGTDYTVSYSSERNATSFSVAFAKTDNMVAAFAGKISISYATQMANGEDGVLQPGEYVNIARTTFGGDIDVVTRVLRGSTETQVTKNVRTDENGNETIVRNEDGTYTVGWHVVANGLDDITANRPLSEDMVVVETLPAGMELVEGSLRYSLYKDSVSTGVRLADGEAPEYTTEVVDGRTVVTMTIPVKRFIDAGYARGSMRAIAVIDLDTRSVDPVVANSYKAFLNEVSAKSGSVDLGGADKEVLIRNSALEKSALYLADTGNKLGYTINVNAEAADLDAESDTVTVWDLLDANTTLEPATFKVTSLDTEGNDVDDITSACTIAGATAADGEGDQTTKVMITLPDQTAVRVYYEAVVSGNVGDKVTVTNRAGLTLSSDSDEENVTTVEIKQASVVGAGRAGTYTFTKVDSTDLTKRLAGAKFDLYRVTDIATGAADLVSSATSAAADSVRGTVVWNKDGKNTTLLLGELYYFVETKAPEGYFLDDTKHYFMLEGGNYDANFAAARKAGLSVSTKGVGTVLNAPDLTEPDPVTVNISKTDVAGAELPGATIKIVSGESANGTVVETWVSDGSTYVTELQHGVYTLVEESAPKGYLIAESITFEVGEDNTIKIRQEDGTYVDAVDSTVVMVDGVEEEPTPDPTPDPTPVPDPEKDPTPDPTPDPGPTPDDPGQTPDDPGSTPVSDKPEPKPGDDPTPGQNQKTTDVNIKKTDMAGEELPGATIKIVSGESAQGTVVESWVSDGSARTVALKPGVYTLVEESAPKGYLIAESITFTVAADSTVKVRQDDGTFVDASDSTVVMVDGVDEDSDQPKQDPEPHDPVDNPSTDPSNPGDPSDDKKDDPNAPGTNDNNDNGSSSSSNSNSDGGSNNSSNNSSNSSSSDNSSSSGSSNSDNSSSNGSSNNVNRGTSSNPLPTPATPAAPSGTSTPSTSTTSTSTTAAKTADVAPIGALAIVIGLAGTASLLAWRKSSRTVAGRGRHAVK